MNRSISYVATRVLIGLLIGMGMFYFRAAHAQTGNTTPYWGTYQTANGQFGYYGSGNNVTVVPAQAGYSSSTAVYQRAPNNSPASRSLSAAGYGGKTPIPTAGGPVLNANRMVVAGSRSPAVMTVPEALKLSRNVLAPAARTLARGYPLVMVGLAAYQMYQDDGIKYDTADQRWEIDVTDTVPPLNAVGNISTHGATIYTGSQPVTGTLTNSSARTLVNQWAAVGTNCTSAGHKWFVESDSTNNARNACSANAQFGDYRGYAAVEVIPGSACPSGYTFNNGICRRTQQVPVSDAQLDEAWRNGNGSLENPQQEASVVPQLDQNNIPIDLTQAQTTATPPTTTHVENLGSTTTTTTNPDGSTTTLTKTTTAESTFTNNTTTNNNTYFKETIVQTTIIREVTRDQNNNIVKEETQQPGPPDSPPGPDPLPEDPPPELDEPNPTGAFSGPGGSAKTFSESLTDFKTRVAAAPILAGISGIAAGIPTGGTCPTASFDALGHTFTLNAHCPLLDQFKTAIRGFFLLGWALFSVMLFLRA